MRALQVLPSFTGFYLVLLGFTGFYRVLLGFTGFYWVLPSFTGFYWVLPSFTVYYWNESSGLAVFSLFFGIFVLLLFFFVPCIFWLPGFLPELNRRAAPLFRRVIGAFNGRNIRTGGPETTARRGQVGLGGGGGRIRWKKSTPDAHAHEKRNHRHQKKKN